MLQVVIKNLGTLHGITQVGTVDVPSAPYNIIWVEKREHIAHGSVDRVTMTIVSKFDGGGHEERSPVIGFLGALLRLPGKAKFVGNCSGDAGAVKIYEEERWS